MLLGAAARERASPTATTGAETAQLTLALLAPLLESQSRVDAGLIPGTINALLNFLQALTPTALKDTPRTCIVGLERVLQKWLVLDPEKLSESGAQVADIASALTAFMLARYIGGRCHPQFQPGCVHRNFSPVAFIHRLPPMTSSPPHPLIPHRNSLPASISIIYMLLKHVESGCVLPIGPYLRNYAQTQLQLSPGKLRNGMRWPFTFPPECSDISADLKVGTRAWA